MNFFRVLGGSLVLLIATYAQADLPDPTRPFDYGALSIVTEGTEADVLLEQEMDWNVTAIMISDKKRTAIVNNTLLRVNDSIGMATVVEITPLSVLLDYQGKHIQAKLFGDSVRKKMRVE